MLREGWDTVTTTSDSLCRGDNGIVLARVVPAGIPVFFEVAADALQAVGLNQRMWIEQCLGNQFGRAQNAVAGPESQPALHPMESEVMRSPRNFRK